MDTKNSVSNTNIKETGKAGGNDIPTIDMSGTNLPAADNTKSLEERASDVRVVDGTTKDNSFTSANMTATEIENARPKHTAPKLPTVKVRLLGSHTHEGMEYDEGDIIDVDSESAKYLETVEAGVKV